MAGNADSIYVAKRASLLTNPTAATVWLQADNSSKASAVYVPDQWFTAQSLVSTTLVSVANLGSLNFRVRASGRATGGTTTNFTPAIQFGTSTTAGSNTTVATATARAVNSTSAPWFIDATFVWDYTSKRLDGTFYASNGSAGTTDTVATTTQVTAVDFSTNGLGFVVSALFSATNAGNLCYLDALVLEAI